MLSAHADAVCGAGYGERSSDELSKLPPREQDALFERSIAHDPDADDRIRPEFLAHVRARLQARMDFEDSCRTS